MSTSRSTNNGIEISELPYLLFTIGKNIYGICSEFVRSIDKLGNTAEKTSVQAVGSEVRGGMIFQDSFIYLLDLRKCFGLDTQMEEFEKAVQPEERIKDHENWVMELEKSVRDNSEFMLTSDPHMCALGKWYYNFESDNNLLKYQIKAIEAPHTAVHNTAVITSKLMREGKHDEALEVINQMKLTHFKSTVDILSSLREIVQNTLNELYIVFDAGGENKAIIVDSIVGLEYLGDKLETPDSIHNLEYIDFLAQRKSDGSIIVVLKNTLK